MSRRRLDTTPDRPSRPAPPCRPAGRNAGDLSGPVIECDSCPDLGQHVRPVAIRGGDLAADRPSIARTRMRGHARHPCTSQTISPDRPPARKPRFDQRMARSARVDMDRRMAGIEEGRNRDSGTGHGDVAASLWTVSPRRQCTADTLRPRHAADCRPVHPVAVAGPQRSAPPCTAAG